MLKMTVQFSNFSAKWAVANPNEKARQVMAGLVS
jgi:hypothetical protein